MKFPAHIDDDLKRIWTYVPLGIPGMERRGGIDVLDYDELYGQPAPWRFRPVRQNGSRIRLRLLRPDGTDAKYPTRDFIERAAFTSDLRRGVYWTSEQA